MAEARPVRRLESLEEAAYVHLLRAADALTRPVEHLLSTAGLSPAQYNVLRILRGAGAEGLACREIGERMIARDPDITRLLDRMEARKLVTRARDRRDRRVITVRISGAGLRILRELDRPVRDVHRHQLGHVGPRKLALLIRLLEQARSGPRNRTQGFDEFPSKKKKRSPTCVV